MKKVFIRENAFENVIFEMGAILFTRRSYISQSNMRSHEISPTDVENVENKFKIVKSDVVSVKDDDVIKWKHSPRYWPFARGIHRSTVNSPHQGQWRGALMFSLICAWTNGWVNNRYAGDLRRHCAHYDVTVMLCQILQSPLCLLQTRWWTNAGLVLWRVNTM